MMRQAKNQYERERGKKRQYKPEDSRDGESFTAASVFLALPQLLIICIVLTLDVFLPVAIEFPCLSQIEEGLLDTWQVELPFNMNYDKARPGAQVLHVALARLIRQEITQNVRKRVITVLMGTSTFYDAIDIDVLAQAAHDLQYPPLPLCLALQTIQDQEPSWQKKGSQSTST